MKKSRLAIFAVLMLLVSGIFAGFTPQVPPNSVLVINLGGDIPETVSVSPLMALFSEPEPTVLDKIMMIKEASRDDRIKGLVVRITTAEYGLAKAQEFRDAILKFREKSQKPVLALIETEGGGNLEYYLASACDSIYAAPASAFSVSGLAMSRYYLGGLWEKIYVDMQVLKIKEYKSFGDMLSRKSMSDAEREMNNSILDSMFGQFVAGIAKGRGESEAKVREWIDQGYTDNNSYLEIDAIDGLKYLDGLVKEIGGKQLLEKEYREFLSLRKPRKGDLRVAVIYGAGPIVTGDSAAGPFGRGAIMASGPMVKKLHKAMEDDAIDAVIFRVDSGGGSALASDLIWKATQDVKEKKPIVISMSDTAGSGGYYIACGASSVVAQPGTITGSIGIITAHPSIGRLLNKIGITVETMSRGEFADMESMADPLDQAELDRTFKSISALYDVFIKRVAFGRGMDAEEVNEIGRGRVWTGEQAVRNGLVDKLGGFDVAIDEVKRLLKAEDKEVTLVYGREKITLWKLITGQIEESVIEQSLTKGEIELLRALRVQGLFEPGRPLALMPGEFRVR